MNEIEKILNKGHQRAGLLAVITGILQTTSCDATKKSIINTLEHIFDEYPVGDTIEKVTVLTMKAEVEDKEDTSEANMKAMFDQIMYILKN
jgi:hypothetical protein